MNDMAMKYEDWLRGCVHHDGRKGNVYLPCDIVLEIADWIEAHRDVAPVRHEEDGTLWVTVEDCEKVGRVIVRNEQGHFCRVFYMGDGDEEPVRHGRWIEYGENKDGTHNIRCSKCGAGLKSKGHADSYYTKRKYRYCRNCGAKMDEGKTDE